MDPDPGQAGFATLAPGALARTYGNFTFDSATGAWGYTLNNAAANVQALAAGQLVQDVLTVTSLDGTASRTITVDISGAPDGRLISFDPFNGGGDSPLGNFAGLTWSSNFYVTDPDFSGPLSAAAYNAFGERLSAFSSPDGSEFDFVSADLANWAFGGTNVTVRGFKDGIETESLFVPLTGADFAYLYQNVIFDFQDVDRLEFEANTASSGK